MRGTADRPLSPAGGADDGPTPAPPAGSSPAALFDMDAVPVPEPVRESPTVRRTKRQAALLARGRHPLSGPFDAPLFLHPDAAPAGDRSAPGRRCGTCRWRQLLGGHSRSYPKCLLPGIDGRGTPRVSAGEATDIRAWWPACPDHEYAPAVTR